MRLRRTPRPASTLSPRAGALAAALAVVATVSLGLAPASGAGVPPAGVEAVDDATEAGMEPGVEPVDGADTPASSAGPEAASPAPRTQGRAQGEELRGTFRLAAGQCEGGAPEAGSWFRMESSGGDPVSNNGSPCGDRTYTPLSPGTDGGLDTTAYQPAPDPRFGGPGGSGGDALADRVIEPQEFFGFDFSVVTEEQDAQTETAVPVPTVTHDGGSLSGDLRAWGVDWNGQHFNQGAPKPDGSTPRTTQLPEGTYDAGTGAFALQWRSLIVGGPFDGFTGIWHLEGTFQPAAGTPGTTASPGGGTSSGPAGSGGVSDTGSASGPAAGRTGSTAAGSGRLPQTGGGTAAVMAVGLVASAAALRRLIERGR